MAVDEAWEAAEEAAELIAEHEPERAIEQLEALIERQPRNEYAHFFLGSAHYELGNYAKALRAYVSALDIAPNYLGAMVNAGHALRMLGRYDQAIRMGQQVLLRQKDDRDALFLLGSAHFARGDNAAAADFLNRFLAQQPDVEAATEAEGMLQLIRGEVVVGEPEPEPD